MSLIQEALRRKSEEAKAAPTVRPETPAAEKKNNKPLIGLLILLLIISVLAILSGVAVRLLKVPVLEPVIETIPAPAVSPNPMPTVTPVIEQVSESEPVVNKPPVPPPEDVWPELRLTGVASSGNRTIAIINGKMLSAGNTLGAVTIVRVDNNQVIVEYHGKRRVLHVDE